MIIRIESGKTSYDSKSESSLKGGKGIKVLELEYDRYMLCSYKHMLLV